MNRNGRPLHHDLNWVRFVQKRCKNLYPNERDKTWGTDGGSSIPVGLYSIWALKDGRHASGDPNRILHTMKGKERTDKHINTQICAHKRTNIRQRQRKSNYGNDEAKRRPKVGSKAQQKISQAARGRSQQLTWQGQGILVVVSSQLSSLSNFSILSWCHGRGALLLWMETRRQWYVRLQSILVHTAFRGSWIRPALSEMISNLFGDGRGDQLPFNRQVGDLHVLARSPDALLVASSENSQLPTKLFHIDPVSIQAAHVLGAIECEIHIFRYTEYYFEQLTPWLTHTLEASSPMA